MLKTTKLTLLLGLCLLKVSSLAQADYIFKTPVSGVKPATCDLPWGGQINTGNQVQAFLADSVPFGQVCTSQTRICGQGFLTGSYQFNTCAEANPLNCATPWNATVMHGQPVTAYQTATVPFGQTCASQSVTCDNGSLPLTFTHQTCTESAPSGCATPWNTQVAHGESVVAYQSATVPFGQSCVADTKTCNNGTLALAYLFNTCSVATPKFLADFTQANGPYIETPQNMTYTLTKTGNVSNNYFLTSMSSVNGRFILSFTVPANAIAPKLSFKFGATTWAYVIVRENGSDLFNQGGNTLSTWIPVTLNLTAGKSYVLKTQNANGDSACTYAWCASDQVALDDIVVTWQ